MNSLAFFKAQEAYDNMQPPEYYSDGSLFENLKTSHKAELVHCIRHDDKLTAPRATGGTYEFCPIIEMQEYIRIEAMRELAKAVLRGANDSELALLTKHMINEAIDNYSETSAECDL